MGIVDDILGSIGLNTGGSVVPPTPSMGASDAVAEAVEPPTVAAAAPAASLGAGGGAAPIDDPNTLAALRLHKVPEETINWLRTQSKYNQVEFMKTVFAKGPPKSTEAPVDKEALIAMFPDNPRMQQIIRSASPSALSNILSTLASRESGGGSDSFKPDLVELKRRRPDLAPYADFMSPADISDIMKETFGDEQKAKAQGGVAYEDVKGKSVKIVQDAAFLRAGHKSGDVICIRIP